MEKRVEAPARNITLMSNGAASSEQTERKIDARVYLVMLVFRWKLIAVCFLYALLGAVAYIQTATPRYVSTLKFRASSDDSLQVTKARLTPSASQYRMRMQNPQLHQRIAAMLADEWAPKIGGRKNLEPTVNVIPMGEQGRLSAAYIESPYPEYDRAFLARLWDEFVKEQRASFGQGFGVETGRIQKELDELEHEIDRRSADLNEFKRVHRIAYIEKMSKHEAAYLGQLRGRHMQLSTELMMLELQLPVIAAASPALLHDVIDLTEETGRIGGMDEIAPAIGLEEEAADETDGGEDGEAGEANTALPGGLLIDEGEMALGRVGSGQRGRVKAAMLSGLQSSKVRLMHLEDERADLLKTLKPNHPDVARIDAELARIRRGFEISAEVAYQRLKDRQQALQLQLQVLEVTLRRWHRSHLEANVSRAKLRSMEMILGRLRGAYDSLYSRVFDVKIQEMMDTQQFGTLGPPHTRGPVWPEPRKILLIMCTLGLGAGLGLALLVHVTDDKVQSMADVEAELGLPFLGGVPYWGRGVRAEAVRPIVTEEHATGAVEAYRAVRTHVLSAMNRGAHKAAIITSADSREGKTLTALNLAIMVAETGGKVLLVDGDLRRGRIYRSLGVDRKPGFLEALAEGLPLREVMVPTRIDNLWFVPAGGTHQRCSELLQGRNLGQLFGQVLDEYDYVFIDTSPVLRTSDTVVMAEAGFAAVICVTHVDRTPKRYVKYSLDLLKNASVLGLIVNNINMYQISSIYYAYQYPNYAYYAYAYRYGYDYYEDDNRRQRAGRGRIGYLKREFNRLGREIRQRFGP